MLRGTWPIDTSPHLGKGCSTTLDGVQNGRYPMQHFNLRGTNVVALDRGPR